MILPYKGITPTIGNNVYIAPTAVVIGDVVLEDNVSVWFGAVIRGDRDRIVIRAGTNVQENCTLHEDRGNPLTIGKNVTIGHNAIVHGCTIEDNVLIGINAVVLNDAVVRAGSVVAAGAVVSQGFEMGPLQMAAGVPAKIKKTYDQSQIEHNMREAGVYIELARDYMPIKGVSRTM